MIKALIFDVFGTVVDWRSSVILECKILEEKLEYLEIGQNLPICGDKNMFLLWTE